MVAQGGGHLREVVTYRRWLLTGSFTNSNWTDGGTNQDFGSVVALREVVAQGGSTVNMLYQ